MRLIFALLLLLPLTLSTPSHRKVLLISLDGFRNDLLTEKLVPNIHKFATASSWFVKGVKSQMLTVTASNHMSIVTGLREAEHGIIGNYFWDRTKKEMYDKFNIAGGADIREDSEKSKWSKTLGKQIDPIWLLNQNNGGKSTVINWPAGDYERSEQAGVKMTRYRQGFGDNSNWPGELELVIESLATNNLVLWYIAEPDSVLHGNGFNNGKLNAKLGELDVLFKDLLTKMEEKGFMKNTDIILTADHGHIQVEKGKTLCVNTILGNIVNDPEYHAGDSNIYHSNTTKVQEIFGRLKTYIEAKGLPYKVYLQKDVPSAWQYVNAERTGDIVIEPLAGGQVKMNCKSDHDDSHTSNHGQNPNLDEMRALLVMGGPSFEQSKTITEIPENIDIFPLMARLLQIRPEPKSSGKLENLGMAIRNEEESTTPSGKDEHSAASEDSDNDSNGGGILMNAMMSIASLMIII